MESINNLRALRSCIQRCLVTLQEQNVEDILDEDLFSLAEDKVRERLEEARMWAGKMIEAIEQNKFVARF